MYRRVFFSLLVIVLVLSACASPVQPGPNVSVEGAWARPAAVGSMGDSGAATEMPSMPGMSEGGTNSAVYFVIENDGAEADTLIGAKTEVAGNAELHETRVQNDVAEMVPVPRVEVPAGGRVEFQPGGYHVMLIGLTQDLQEGDTLKLTLQFEKSGEIQLDVPVRLGQ